MTIDCVGDCEVNDCIVVSLIQIFWLGHLGFRIGKQMVERQDSVLMFSVAASFHHFANQNFG